MHTRPIPEDRAPSFYNSRPEDCQAVYFTPEYFHVAGDGIADDAEALQQAVNKVQEITCRGILFIPEGRYRLSRTVYVWSGIRLIGYGKNRPVFVLGENTPGYQTGEGRYMIHFASDRPAEGKPVRDANPGTFYSALSNIDFEIQEGNPAAVAIRSFYAQHCYISHADFYIGCGKAGIGQVGNEMEDCRFFGGDYGIMTAKPSASWPFLLIDSYFKGQRIAAIETEEGGLTLIRNHFEKMPCAIMIRPDRAEELFLADSTFKEISGPAVIISDEHNARQQINLKNIVCIGTPVVAFFRESRKKVEGSSSICLVKDFSHGLQIDDLGYEPEIKTTSEIVLQHHIPEPVKPDIPVLPSSDTWVNLASLGAIGDSVTDNTEILMEAISKYSAIYIPSGRYRVTDTITMKQDTVIIGLNPITTQLILSDRTPAFHGEGAPKPLLAAPRDGKNIVAGIGLDTGGINNRAVAVKWMAGPESMMNDVRLLGGHGTYKPDGSWVAVYNDNRTGDGITERKWDSQYWSLWITDEGGGTFKDIWSPSPYAQAGIYISDTSTEGRIYAASVEHHVRYEVKLHNVSNWRLYDLQMEEESGESWNALPLHMENCSNIAVANLYLYRVIRMVSPYPYGIRTKNCHDIEFCGVHVYSPTKFSFDNTVYDQTYGAEIRAREISRLKISGNPPKEKIMKPSPVLAPGAVVRKAAGGFQYIDGAAVDRDGNVYFIDARWHFIYRWCELKQELALISDIPISPVALAFDRSGNLMVVSKSGTVFAFNPDCSIEGIRVLEPAAFEVREDCTVILPGHRWRDLHDFIDAALSKSETCFISPDGTTVIPKCEDLARACSLRPAIHGKPFYLADEFGQKTYVFDVTADGTLAEPRIFAEEGEQDTAVDEAGNVYVAAGNIFVYDKTGRQIDRIDVPERPSCIVFGGSDRKTLYITARSSLYKVETRFKGR